MTYIKIDDKPYLGFENLRQILKVSSEVLGSFKLKEDKKGAKTKTNIKLDKNVFKLKREMLTEKFDNIKHEALFDIQKNKIVKKINEIIFLENKIKLKNDLLNKSKNDPDFIFSKKEVIDNYEKLYSDIDNAQNQEELNEILI